MSENIEEPKPLKCRNGNGSSKSFVQFKEVVEAKIEPGARICVHTHPFADPDAMASMMGIKWLLEKVYEVEVDMFVAGEVSHPQNINMVNLLAPKLIPADQCCPSDYNLRILVDVIPSNAGTAGKSIDFDIVIDHHVEQTNGEYEGLFINLHTGSCAATIHHLIKFYGQQFEEDNDHDQIVATALIIGIATDTCYCQGDGTTDYDHDSSKELFLYRDPEAIQKILKYKKQRFWVQKMAEAAQKATVQDTVGIVGLGLLTNKQRDLIAVMADEMLTWDGIDTAITFAIVDGDRIEGSVRTMNPAISAAKLCYELGTDKGGQGWGHSKKAAYKYNLGGMSIDANDEMEIQLKTWNLAEEREIIRIQKLVKK